MAAWVDTLPIDPATPPEQRDSKTNNHTRIGSKPRRDLIPKTTPNPIPRRTTVTTKNRLTKVKRSTAKADPSLMPDATLAAAAMQRQRESAESAARLVDAEGPAIGLITSGVLKLCASAFPDAIGAKLVIEQDEYKTVELHLPVHPALTASPATVATEPAMTAEEKKQLYVNMVKHVRAWLAVEHHRQFTDRIDICLYDDMGSGETLACFHADADDAYVLGDLMAIESE